MRYCAEPNNAPPTHLEQNQGRRRLVWYLQPDLEVRINDNDDDDDDG